MGVLLVLRPPEHEPHECQTTYPCWNDHVYDVVMWGLAQGENDG